MKRLQPEARKAQILEKAYEMLAENRLVITTLAEELGIVQGTVYHYFPTHADLMGAVYARAIETQDAPMVAKALSENHPLTKELTDDQKSRVWQQLASAVKKNGGTASKSKKRESRDNPR